MQCLAGDYLLRPETLKYTVEKCTLNNPTMKQTVHAFYSLTHFEYVELSTFYACINHTYIYMHIYRPTGEFDH